MEAPVVAEQFVEAPVAEQPVAARDAAEQPVEASVDDFVVQAPVAIGNVVKARWLTKHRVRLKEVHGMHWRTAGCGAGIRP